MESQKFTFLQFSDVRLDLPQNQGLLSYSSTQRLERYTDLIESFINALRVAQDKQVDAVFLPGGLFNLKTIRLQTIELLLDAIAEISPIPVVITAGSLDPYQDDSAYNSDFLKVCGIKPWPENVHVFASSEFEAVKLPNRPDVTVVGMSHVGTKPNYNQVLSQPLPKDESSLFNILVFSGALESYQGPIYPQLAGPNKPAPFTEEQLESQDFDYAAVGGYPDLFAIYAPNQRVLGAYSGCLSSSTFEELGPKVAILGQISYDPERGKEILLEPIEVSSFRLVYLAVDITGLDAEAIKEEIEYCMQEQDVRPDHDIVALSLEGSFAPEADPLAVIKDIESDFYRLIFVNRTRPNYLSQEFDPRTTEARYVERMLQRLQEAERKMAELSGRDSLTGLPGAFISAKTVEDALYYGLDALKQKRVTIRHVD